MQQNENYEPLNIARDITHSLPEENKDIQQIQEPATKSRGDNCKRRNSEEKKKALKTIIDDYNRQYKTNHTIAEFDAYYQDVQKRIKDQQYVAKTIHTKIRSI